MGRGGKRRSTHVTLRLCPVQIGLRPDLLEVVLDFRGIIGLALGLPLLVTLMLGPNANASPQ